MNTADDIDQEMQSLADYAVRAAQERFSTHLSYEDKSLVNLESLLYQAWRRFAELRSHGKLTEEIVTRTVEAWGAYFGEVIRRELGGQWFRKPTGPVLVFDGRLMFSPFDSVLERLTDEPHYSILVRYDALFEEIRSLKS